MARSRKPKPRIIATRQDAATALGVTERTLARWVKEPWWPEDAVERTRGGRLVNWNIDRIRAAVNAMGRKGSDQTEEAALLKRAIDREKLEQARIVTQQKQLELAAQEGELVPRRAVELHFATLLTELGDWCEQLPTLLAADLPSKYRAKFKARAVGELNRRRRELADELQRAAREMDQQRPAAATPAAQ